MLRPWLLIAASHAGIALAGICQGVPGPKARVVAQPDHIVIGNGYTCIVVSLSSPRISQLRADFTGKGQYGKNVLANSGISLGRLDEDGTVHSSADGGRAVAKVANKSEDLVEVVVTGIADAAGDKAAATETWTLSLAAGERSVKLRINGALQRDISAKALRRNFAFMPSSIYGLFDRGVVQMKGYDAKLLQRNKHWSNSKLLRFNQSLRGETTFAGHHASKDTLDRLYALGGIGESRCNSCCDIDLGKGHTDCPMGGSLGEAGNTSVSVRRGKFQSQGVVLLNSASGGLFGHSGFQEILAGSLPEQDVWTSGWSSVGATQILSGLQWNASYEIAPNNFDFPAQGPFGDLSTEGNIEDKDLQAMLTGIYGSPVGQLCTHDNGVVLGHRVGQMATTIARPDYGYGGLYNFFDPDNYISVSAMLFSGDPYLQEQVRVVIERNGDFMNHKGQLPHHFQNTEPTFQAISGETQTGPNVFWILSCFMYAKTTGNLAWLKEYMPTLRNASAFLFDMIQPQTNLLKSPGSLMIDVFIRNNYTTDTNAMAVGFLRDFADAEEATGNSTGAVHLRNIATMVAEATDAMLWNKEADDHYFTQLNPDGSTRDFVDYDANLIALAHGLASADRAKKVFARVDGGRCIHGRATFVSELYYGKDDTTDGNIGDSWCSMGRIGWFDALARKRYGDQSTFDNVLLDPLIGDVNRWTWLHERYNCDGTPQRNRTSHYFEYPSVTAMMLHYIRYGIQLGFDSVKVSPFGPKNFTYHIGNIHVDYNGPAETVRLSTPGTGMRQVVVEGLTPDKIYKVRVGPGPSTLPWPRAVCVVADDRTVTADRDGGINFQAHVGDLNGPCVITITQQSLR